jgi:hypothetical protein
MNAKAKLSNKLLCKEIHQFSVTKTEFDEIETRYSNLSEFLTEHLKSTVLKEYFPESSQTFIEIIVLGGFALKNATKQVREKGQNKFNDLDLKIVFSHHFQNAKPEILVEVVKTGLELYAKKHSLETEGNERCNHLYYKDITIDISAAVRTSKDSLTLKVPIYDESTKTYSYEFEKPEAFIGKFNEAADREKREVEEVRLKNDAGVDVEDLEFQKGFLGTIRYASMLMKSHKNKFFSKDEEAKKSVKSILLSVLSLNNYSQGLGVIETIDNAIRYLDLTVRDPHRVIVIADTSDPTENYADYLNRDFTKRELFISWLNHFKLSWESIKQSGDIIDLAEAFKAIFDEETIKAFFNKAGKDYTRMVDQKKLHIAVGGIISTKPSPATFPITRNSNWGTVTSFEQDSSILRFNEISLADQIQDMKKYFPQFKVVHTPLNCVEWQGELISPFSNSLKKVIIRFNPDWLFPRVFVEGVTSKAPHIHISLGDCLCLFKPKYSTWNYSMSVSKTIVPWTLSWIVQWEVWKVTGKFNGHEEKH